MLQWQKHIDEVLWLSSCMNKTSLIRGAHILNMARLCSQGLERETWCVYRYVMSGIGLDPRTCGLWTQYVLIRTGTEDRS